MLKKLLWLTVFSGLINSEVGQASPKKYSCEERLVDRIHSLNFLDQAFRKSIALVKDRPSSLSFATDFETYTEAASYLDNLHFIEDFDDSDPDRAAAIQTWVLWRFQRRLELFETAWKNLRPFYSLNEALYSLSEFIFHAQYRPYIGDMRDGSDLHSRIVLDNQSTMDLQFRRFATTKQGFFNHGDQDVFYFRFNGFIHVLRKSVLPPPIRLSYSVFDEVKRANVSSPIHFAYFMEATRGLILSTREGDESLLDFFRDTEFSDFF